MAKTFNPNRVGGGTVSIVRAADGTYSLKETGFDQISSLNMIDLGAVAKVTPTLPVQPDDGVEELKDQTKAAFLLPNQGRDDDPLTFEKSLKSGADISQSLQTTFDKPNMREVAGNRVSTFDAMQEDSLENRTSIKSPTETVFGTADDATANILPDPKVETPQEKLKVTSANVQKGLVEPPLKGMLETLKGPMLKTDQTRFTKPSERAALGFPGDKSEVAQAGSTGFLSGIDTRSDQGLTEVPATALGVTAEPSKTMAMKQAELASGTITPISTPAKKTFVQSATTALKNIGDTAAKLAAMSPTLQLVGALGKQRNEDQSTIGLNKRKFNVVTSSGSMQGRIVGDDGSYDPGNNLFHGMNRDSAFGNLEKAGQKRIDRINKTLEKQAKKGKQSQTLIDRKNKFEKELRDYKVEKAAEQKATQGPAGGATTDSGGGGGSAGGKIVCTMMNQSYGFGSFRNKIWMKFHKDLSPEYQRGYHRLFLPLVRIAKTNKIIKNILEHIAVHSTIDMRQSMRGKKHLLGRVYRKILLPICYWAGKK